MKGRILALGVLLTLCALLLCSCGRGAKSEKQIKADILEKGVMDVMAVSDVPIEEISSLKILKRQTNKELKTDYVYVTVEADTETAHFVRSMKLTYNYYDDQGWVLDGYESYAEGEENTTPKKVPDERVLDNFFSRFSSAHCTERYFVDYSSWTLDDVTADLENCEATMQVTASRETRYIKTTESLTMTAHFMPDSCSWEVEGDSVGPYLTKLSYELNVEPGDYYGTNDPGNAFLTIHKYSPEDEGASSISLDLKTSDLGDYSDTHFSMTSFSKSKENRNLDYNNIQETAQNKDELDTLSFLQFYIGIGLHKERYLGGKTQFEIIAIVMDPSTKYDPYLELSPFSLWIDNFMNYLTFKYNN